MHIHRLRQVFVVARDLERSVEFYQRTLGLELQFRDGDRWVQFRAGEVSFALASVAEGQGARPGQPVPVFEVDDLDAALTELGVAEASPGAVREMGPHGRSALTVDPSGTRIMLFEKARG